MKPIQVLIDEELKRKENTPRKRSGLFSPSLFGRCIRMQVWARADVKKTDEPEDRLLRVFKAGSLFHDFVQEVIKKNNPDIQTEVECGEDDVKGFADIVNGESVTDIKSVHSGAFHYMQDDISESKKPNILQCGYYALRLNKKKFSICFVSKDDLCIKEVSFILNDKWKKEIADEITALRTAWEKYPTIMPEAKPRAYVDKNGKSKECSYCGYKKLCKEVEDAVLPLRIA